MALPPQLDWKRAMKQHRKAQQRHEHNQQSARFYLYAAPLATALAALGVVLTALMR